MEKTAPAGLYVSTHYPVATFRGIRTKKDRASWTQGWKKTAPAGLKDEKKTAPAGSFVSTHYPVATFRGIRMEKDRASWT